MEKIGVLAIQKVAKTGNIEKKSPVAGDIDYVRYLSMRKVQKLAKFKILSICKTILLALNFFIHLFNRSVKCMQNIERIQWKL